MITSIPSSGRNTPERRASSNRHTHGDMFVLVMAGSLVGYAVFGKGFAYLGVAPFYIGEIMLLLGCLVLLRTGCMIAAMGSIPSWLLVLLMAWVVARSADDLLRYGIDALRDSVVVLYGAFAFIVAALLLDKPSRIDDLVRRYRQFSTGFVILAPVILVFSNTAPDRLPAWPNSGLPLFAVRTGEAAVHLAGATVFALLGFRRQGWMWSLCLLLGIAVVFSQSRGGLLAIAAPATIAALFAWNGQQVFRLVAIAALVVTFAVLLDVNIQNPSGRNLDFDQFAANLTSIFSGSTTGNLDGTKEWRMRWWETIFQYTVHGEHFWFGKGFGINLAVADGFVVGLENGGAPLRSPHNVHLTILARSGVPGLALWGLMLASWFVMVLRNARVAWRDGEPLRAKFFLFIACYVLAALIDASFDVAIEGPMIGIWFWVLIGIGLGSSMEYWSRYPKRSVLRWTSSAVILPLVIFAALSFPMSSPAQPADRTVEAVKTSKTIANPSGTCLAVQKQSEVVIENLRIGPCGKHGIEFIDSRNVVIRNVTIENTGEIGIRMLGSERIDVRGNLIGDTQTSVYAQDSRQLNVSCNSFRNARGPIPRGQFVQFNEVHGSGNRISCNIGRNEPGHGQPEDAISMYRSSGTPESPILIENNTIVGGGPSPSGGGIMLGDAGGSYLAARGNVLEDPGQYGIGVAGGHDIEISGNVVMARRQPFTNVGISVWRQYATECRDITVKDNFVNWVSKSGRPNPWWDGKNCGTMQGLGTNTFRAAQSEVDRHSAAMSCICR
jgi:hypothetical protein